MTDPVNPEHRFVAATLFNLRVARELLKKAGAVRALDRVRRAIKSTEGAGRHAMIHTKPRRVKR